MEQKLLNISMGILCLVCLLTFGAHTFDVKGVHDQQFLPFVFMTSDLDPAPYPTDRMQLELMKAFEAEQLLDRNPLEQDVVLDQGDFSKDV